MIELAKHIEVLLLGNDCVIVPGLGGFIAHNRQAEFKESENLFSAPARTIGFNPQLVMNDGLLVQTYMQAYSTDFPDATRKIEKLVSTLKEQLYQKGEVFLPNVGTLYYTMNGTYIFEPSTETFFTPYLYGLESIKLSPLHAINTTKEEVTIHPYIRPHTKEINKGYTVTEVPAFYSRAFHRMVQHAVGVAAAILLFFLLSVPVENTYMDDASYASLSAESMFDAIRGRSVATQVLNSENKDLNNKKGQRTRNNVNTLRPVCAKNEFVAPSSNKKTYKVADYASLKTELLAKDNNKTSTLACAINKSTTSVVKTKETTTAKRTTVQSVVKDKPSKNYHIIVASLATTADAEKQLKVFKSNGFTDARIIESNSRHRIALYSFEQQTEAYKKLKELRTQDTYQSAWILTSK